MTYSLPAHRPGSTDEKRLEITVPDSGRDQRLDLFLLETGQFQSRHQIQRLIRQGLVLLDGLPVKPAHRLKPLQEIQVRLLPCEPAGAQADPIPLRILFEDQDLLIVDKPAGMVVHPAAGHRRYTLVNALLHCCRDLSGIGGTLRPGIVHRIDKGTSGLLVVAKNDAAHLALSRQFEAHSILREYVGLVYGDPGRGEGTVNAPIGRHTRDRKRMSTVSTGGKVAVTFWRIERRYPGFCLMRFTLMTGRTHQIRVHMKELGCPIVGDAVYGHRRDGRPESGINDRLRGVLKGVARPFLHAEKLGFKHPRDGRSLVFSSPLPDELQAILETLEHPELR